MQAKPNVILMFIDDLGIGDVSSYNAQSKVQTGNIDYLAENGIAFTDAHATSSLCTPSRYGLLTGRYNWRSRLKAGVLPGGGNTLIEEGRETIASLFQKNGYFTAAVGKWHLGLGWERKEINGAEYGIREETEKKQKSGKNIEYILDGMNIDFEKPLKISPNDHGFTYFYGTAASLDQPPYTYIENNKVLAVPDHISGVFPLNRRSPGMQESWQRGPTAPGYDHNKVIPDMQEKVLQLIDEHSGEPFFIYYPTHAVHGPLLPPEEFRNKSGLNLYTDMVMYVDHLVGEITEKLKEKNIWENTIFVFASDNGCSAIADYPFLTEHGHNPSSIYRGIKSEIYEGGHRIPFIISWPGKWKRPRSVDSIVSLSDLFETFADILDYEIPEETAEDSFSLIPAIENDMTEIRETVVHSSGGGCFSIRNKEWKLELCIDAGSPMSESVPQEGTSEEFPFQLYNMEQDVCERSNVAPEYPDICLSMMETLLDIIESGKSNQARRCKDAHGESWEQLDKVKEILKMRKSINRSRN